MAAPDLAVLPPDLPSILTRVVRLAEDILTRPMARRDFVAPLDQMIEAFEPHKQMRHTSAAIVLLLALDFLIASDDESEAERLEMIASTALVTVRFDIGRVRRAQA